MQFNIPPPPLLPGKNYNDLQSIAVSVKADSLALRLHAVPGIPHLRAAISVWDSPIYLYLGFWAFPSSSCNYHATICVWDSPIFMQLSVSGIPASSCSYLCLGFPHAAISLWDSPIFLAMYVWQYQHTSVWPCSAPGIPPSSCSYLATGSGSIKLIEWQIAMQCLGYLF